ncbi:hypothetical protein [Methylocaldum sp.]|uniref:hypothetical protein n=1 Tax=Methylocaldum sp. TaxID=1969727 RepID=UPI002D3BF856|nr:hypothetical protein [Methylocaldum sp.]HYE34095.1 hypothetical protein [Methylocaldum sp.]
MADEVWARKDGGNGPNVDKPQGGQYQEQYQELRQDRKGLQQEYRDEVQERARDRGVGREGARPSEMEGGRGSLMTPEERGGYQDQYRELREERKSLRGTTDDAGSGRGGRGQGKNR